MKSKPLNQHFRLGLGKGPIFDQFPTKFPQPTSSNFPNKKQKFFDPKVLRCTRFITVLHENTTPSPVPCTSMAPLLATYVSTASSPVHCTSTTPSPAPCTSTTPSLACTSTTPLPAACTSSCYRAVSTQALIQPYLPVQAQQEGGEGAKADEGGYRGGEKERKVTTPISATSSLWLELSSLQQLTVGAILLPFLYH